jgi:hypothetical protein
MLLKRKLCVYAGAHTRIGRNIAVNMQCIKSISSRKLIQDYNKIFWEELGAYFPLILQGSHIKLKNYGTGHTDTQMDSHTDTQIAR